jgi:hypothetical protein
LAQRLHAVEEACFVGSCQAHGFGGDFEVVGLGRSAGCDVQSDRRALTSAGTVEVLGEQAGGTFGAGAAGEPEFGGEGEAAG